MEECGLCKFCQLLVYPSLPSEVQAVLLLAFDLFDKNVLSPLRMEVRKIASLSDIQSAKQGYRHASISRNRNSRPNQTESIGSHSLLSTNDRLKGAQGRRQRCGSEVEGRVFPARPQFSPGMPSSIGTGPSTGGSHGTHESSSDEASDSLRSGPRIARRRARRAMSMDSASAAAEAARLVGLPSSLRIRPPRARISPTNSS